MRKIEIVMPDASPLQSAYPAPRCRVSGTPRARSVSPAGASIWMLVAEVERGVRIEWQPEHGDEALFVESGELSVDGRTCPEGGVVVVEANAQPDLVAAQATKLVHMGPRDDAPPADGLNGPAATGGRKVHVVGPRGTFEVVEEGRESRFFADATCPTCRLWLLYTARDFAYESQIHSHSQDELIYLLHGEIQLGSQRLLPGAALFIAADQPYHFRAAAGGFGFLNYRRDASEMTLRGTGEKLMEGGAVNGLTPVNDLR